MHCFSVLLFISAEHLLAWFYKQTDQLVSVATEQPFISITRLLDSGEIHKINIVTKLEHWIAGCDCLLGDACDFVIRE